MAATLERQLSRRRMTLRIDAILPLELSAKTPTLAVTPAPIGKPNGPGLWHVKGMQFPPYFQQVRNALIRSGHSTATASQITWGAIRRWARGGGNVHPEVRAAARSALASIAGKEARAHAQHATHEHTTLRDQLILREFARSGSDSATSDSTIPAKWGARKLELADPYHGAPGSGHGGQFVSASQQGSGSPTGKGKPPIKQPGGGPPAVSPQQKKKLLAEAAADDAKALALRQEAAKINQQITALSALIAQEQKALATSATGKTGAGAGTGTAAGKGTQTASAKGTTTRSAASLKASATASKTAKATIAAGGRKAVLAQHQQQVKQLTALRNQLLQHAAVLSAQAASLRQQANG